MNAIVAVNSDWGIGANGVQQIVIPEDRKHFMEITKGGVVLVGRKTLEDCGGPLPGRKNIVLTRDQSFCIEGVVAVNSPEKAFAAVANEDGKNVFVIGGDTVYRIFLPMCEYAYVTKIDAAPLSDSFFPNLDELPEWSIEHKTQSYKRIIESYDKHKEISYSFVLYKNCEITVA